MFDWFRSDDSAPGAIPALPSLQKNGTQAQLEEPHDNPMKRYLQCPGMCRIEVLKKFVRNKYNVDTNLFHIDILYKRVPLPDHYTLIDIGYIYSWKRNEPMKFFFRITDINKVAERFDYFDGRTSPEVIQKPTRIRQSSDRDKTSRGERKKEAAAHNKEVKEETKPSPPAKEETARTEPEVKCEKSEEVKSVVKRNEVKSVKPEVKPVKDEVKSVTAEAKPIKDEVKSVKDETQQNKDEVILKPEITEEIKNKIQSGKSDIKNNVYTNITLNRDDNVEIITKIQKVSNKEGHPIGLNIINHTVKKTNKVQTSKNRPANNPKLVPTSSNVDNKTPSEREKKTEEATPKTEESRDRDREELEKSNFLKSIQLTAKNSLPEPKATTSSPKPMTSSQKRKNSSPVKNEKSQEKKTKIEKKPVKIIIQPKTIQNPAVRQMVTNVNQNVNNMSKIVEQSTTATKTTDLQSLIDNCKINIPSSLSITLNEGGEGGARTPPSIPPVKNYIEILKLPDSNKVEDKEKSKDKEEGKSEKTSPTLMSPAIKDKNRNIQTFQKIFEESIIKKSPEMTNNNNKSKAEGSKPTPLDLTSPNEGSKRKILEIASQLHKKTKLEQEKKKEEVTIGKIAIPRLATQRTLKPTSNKYDFGQNRPQTSASLHSSSLGLNYTVSVGQSEVKAPSPKRVAPSTSKAKPKSSPKGAGMSPNQLLE
ncbi:AIF-MLS domain containing protein, partial [Asbolus verrucosus]